MPRIKGSATENNMALKHKHTNCATAKKTTQSMLEIITKI